jgi:RNA polymerase sigma-70 factor (ECF subfamily)
MTPNWRAQPATAAAPRLAGFTTGYARMVHGILLARVPHGEVDDLVQDVFLAALRQLSALRDDGAFGGWLGMIARNRAHDYHRRAREWTERPDELPVADRHTPDAPAALDAIRALPEAYRETLMLRPQGKWQ